MRVFLDTNVLLSAILFPKGAASRFLMVATERRTILLGSYVIDELRSVFERKFPEHQHDLESFLEGLSYVPVPEPADPDDVETIGLRDRKDEPIVASALAGNADTLVTGDKDLLEIMGKTGLTIQSIREFMEEHG